MKCLKEDGPRNGISERWPDAFSDANRSPPRIKSGAGFRLKTL
jgi:hypothetical protein